MVISKKNGHKGEDSHRVVKGLSASQEHLLLSVCHSSETSGLC